MVIFLPSILTVNSSLGLNGNVLSVTNALGKFMLCLEPTLYIFTFASSTNIMIKYTLSLILSYIKQYSKYYIHTVVYTKV